MSDNTTQKAKVAPVKLSQDLEIEGLLLPSGSYAIAYPQIADLFITGDVEKDGILTSKSQLSQSLKRLCGEDFKTDKAKTEFNKNVTTVVSLPQFEIILAKLDRAGNKQAQQVRDELSGLGLRQKFADAFGEKFEVEERQEWLTQRNEHKKQFQPHLTDWLKEDGVEGRQYAMEVNHFKRNAGCPQKPLKEYTPEELRKLNTAEGQYHILREIGMDHEDASTKIAQTYVPVGDIDLDF